MFERRLAYSLLSNVNVNVITSRRSRHSTQLRNTHWSLPTNAYRLLLHYVCKFKMILVIFYRCIQRYTAKALNNLKTSVLICFCHVLLNVNGILYNILLHIRLRDLYSSEMKVLKDA